MVSGVFRFPEVAQTPSAAVVGRSFIGGAENWILRELLDHLGRTHGVEDNPRWSPILIQGNTGVGKSLLLQLLADTWQQSPIVRNAGGQIWSVSAADWIRLGTRLHHAPGTTWAPIAVRYFLLDDVQLLARCESAQHRLANYLDELDRTCGQAVLAGTLSSGPLPFIERLSSRFASGVTLELQQPGENARQAMIHDWAIEFGWNLDADALRMAARALPANARQLRGSVARLLPTRPVTNSVTNAVLGHSELCQRLRSVNQVHVANPRAIIDCVAQRLSVPVRDIRGPSRRRSVMTARAIAMYLIRELTKTPLKDIGRWFSGRDHSTVLHAVRKIQSSRLTDHDLDQVIRELCQVIRRGIEINAERLVENSLV